ncbi:MAG: class II fructose-bisphosphate aldolase [Candidatus Sumerlaeia bacterium]|nr:class II fructose-bisphosphate aldolase [Candidatus Sumerlaeia bacterium]
MPLATLDDVLPAAQTGRYAVGAFNMVDYASTLAIVRAAEQLRAPVIVQTSVKTVRFWGCAAIASWLREIAGRSPVPVVLHLDHCKDLAVIEQCIAAGWTSVMFDGSAKAFEENLALTQRAAEMASRAGVSLEAELGEIGGVEDDKAVADEDAHLADPEKAVRFCQTVRLSAFAPAIGTAHGIYKGEPKLAFDRLEVIARRTGVPIALHGGTGLSDDVFRKCISLGCAKVNISTQIKYAFIEGFVDYHLAHKEYEPLKPLEAQIERIRREVAEKIELFGSAGRAA